MNKSKLLTVAICAWLAVEVVAFIFVVQFLGLFAAVALGAGTTLLGLADIKRLIVYIRSRLGKPLKETKVPGNVLDSGLHALGSLLLVLPGFASDLVGLALKAPSIRAAIADHVKDRANPRKNPREIDLTPNEWKTLDHGGKKTRRKKAV